MSENISRYFLHKCNLIIFVKFVLVNTFLRSNNINNFVMQLKSVLKNDRHSCRFSITRCQPQIFVKFIRSFQGTTVQKCVVKIHTITTRWSASAS